MSRTTAMRVHPERTRPPSRPARKRLWRRPCFLPPMTTMAAPVHSRAKADAQRRRQHARTDHVNVGKGGLPARQQVLKRGSVSEVGAAPRSRVCRDHRKSGAVGVGLCGTRTRGQPPIRCLSPARARSCLDGCRGRTERWLAMIATGPRDWRRARQLTDHGMGLTDRQGGSGPAPGALPRRRRHESARHAARFGVCSAA